MDDQQPDRHTVPGGAKLWALAPFATAYIAAIILWECADVVWKRPSTRG